MNQNGWQPQGWIRIYRSITDHWIYSDPVKLARWLDILLNVNHANQEIVIGNVVIACKRGESIKSLDTWARRWKTTKSSARRFLQMLSNHNMIKIENVSKTTRIKVCNWEAYQGERNDDETMMKRSWNDDETIMEPNKNDEKEKNVKNEEKTPPNPQGKNIFLANIIFPEYLNNELFKSALSKWLSYKKAKRQSYRSETSIQTLIKNLDRMANGSISTAIEIIDQSIGNNWAGLFELKKSKHNEQKLKPNDPRRALAEGYEEPM